MLGCVLGAWMVMVWAWSPAARAQPAVAAPAPPRAVTVRSAPGAPQPGSPPKTEAKPNQANAKAGEGDKKSPDGDKKEEEEADDSVKRPTEPPRVPDPREFDERLDENGRLGFNFHGQPWPAFLQWLASIGGYSLDWQELPNDYINITTTQRYTVSEACDLINRLLLDRGYTMIRQGQVMSVHKIAKLDPSLIPRINDESELMDHPPYDFVKITFELPDELKADKAAEDVKPLLSSHAKVQPLLATNRLLVVDVVANLREVSQLINNEYAAATGHIVPREFHLRFARADRVADQVMILLGLDPASRRTPQELQLEQQRLQLFTQMQQKGKDVTKYLRKDEPKVYLAVNQQNNSILANAPPAEMRIIELSIEKLDVPGGTLAGAVSSPTTMRKYQLVTLSPQSILTALEEIGDLDPRTRLQADMGARIVFANATARDHEKIQSMIDTLDGTGRQFEVIWLRRLPADAVAATIHELMVGKEEEENNNRRSYIFYYPYRSSREEEKPNKGFRVTADIERNRLLLWASAAELEEVRNFLAKLGEIPGDSGNPNTIRILDARGEKATLRLLQQLRRAWPALAPNELRIEGTVPTPEAEEDSESTEATPSSLQQEHRATVDPPSGIPTHSVHRAPAGLTRLALAMGPGGGPRDDRDLTSPKSAGDTGASAADQSAASPPPITISVTEDGRIIITSADTKALDRLEELLAQIAPPPKNFKVFYLKNALASVVTLNLEEYFAGEGNFDTEENWMRAWYGFDFKGEEKTGTGLASRRKLKFIYDYDTNSILVSNGTPEQMEIVESLIEIYDRAPSEDSISARRFQIFKLTYAKADSVAKTIKEVYRDLLSSKDKEFEGKQDKKQSTQLTTYYRIYGSSDDSDKKATKVKATFEGALSVGVNEISNTVIVSAQEEWMSSIAEMIKYLDEQARPSSTIEVRKVSAGVNPKLLQAMLKEALGTGGKPETAKPEPPNGQGGPEGAKRPEGNGRTDNQ